ncbi:MAG: 1,4-alpha-glucan branching protein GlgB [Lachnospiraceae bacterium]|nr:1,4-alpha-glucan branching protein GlgB [Lachnospiraceae bacterium]MBQ9123816.1 1,4-alpha-glucan branching protein GlgB [Lachnospiraceae bacterium]
MNNKLYKLMNWPAIEEVIYSETSNPHALLGPHPQGTGSLVQMFYPGAKEVTLQFVEDMREIPMEMADEDGFFAVLLPNKKVPAYRYIVSFEDGNTLTMQDAYRHKCLITEKDELLFAEGIHYNIYEKMGAHPMTLDGEEGTYFAVWAPNALRVSVVGDFNGWDGRIHQMRKTKTGIFEIFVPGAKAGQNYKYELKLKGGLTYLKADPYANSSQLRPENASVIANLNYKWKDDKWMEARKKKNTAAPMSVYEVYLGSVLKPKDGREFANYREIAPVLRDNVLQMGYTHVEIMPVMEHPFDASWGYQVIGYYAPTSRYGSPEDFMYLIDTLHKANIGVILDWVPAHFPRDTHGLSNFDGTCLYEHLDPRQGAHPHWGTLIYNYGRAEVKNYLISNALYWAEKYHVDGIRMDAVASMLYLDYGKNDGEWVANIYGSNENLEALEFIKHLNSIMKKRNPGVLMIAEESTAWPMITGDLNEGGLGFDYKWNMGWMNDYLGYISQDPYFRSYHHNELTFSMIYAYSEKFMLVFSHDEVVHGKSSMIGKMPGDIPEKFANLRLTYAYMMTHPGKKLLFMGQDIGEFDEWNEGREVQWELLETSSHKGINDLVRDLNKLYTSSTALYELDEQYTGFEWINCITSERNYLAYLRKGKKKDDILLVVANFSGAAQDITVGVPFAGKYKEILNTDDVKYGGQGNVNSRVKAAANKEWDDRDQSITVKMAPLTVSILKYIPYTKEELEKKKQAKAKKAVAKKETKKC